MLYSKRNSCDSIILLFINKYIYEKIDSGRHVRKLYESFYDDD